MERGPSVIVDSTCNYQEVVDQGSSLAARSGDTYWYVECRVEDINLLNERLQTRSAMPSQCKAAECPPLAAQAAREHEDSRWTVAV